MSGGGNGLEWCLGLEKTNSQAAPKGNFVVSGSLISVCKAQLEAGPSSHPDLVLPVCRVEGALEGAWGEVGSAPHKRTLFLLFHASPGVLVERPEVNPHFDKNFFPCNDHRGTSYGGGWMCWLTCECFQKEKRGPDVFKSIPSRSQACLGSHSQQIVGQTFSSTSPSPKPMLFHHANLGGWDKPSGGVVSILFCSKLLTLEAQVGGQSPRGCFR